MRLETIDFPSDVDCALGDLPRALVRALHKAAEHPDHHKLLSDTLKFATAKLKDAAKDYKEVKAHQEKRRLAQEEAEAVAEKARLADRYGEVTEVIEVLSTEKEALADELGLTDESTDED